jgi:transposase
MAMTTMTEPTTRVTGGVDTHRDVHLVAALDERGAQLGVEAFAADAAGYRKALAWLRRFGTVGRVGVEGTGTYGAGLTRYLLGRGVEVVEVSCPSRQRRRSHGKSDPVDAIAAARAAQGGEASARAKDRAGNVEAIRALRVARRSACKGRNDALNQMRALLVTGPEELRAAFRGTTVWRMVTAAARLRPSHPSTVAGATKFALRELAHRVQALEAELERLDALLVPLVTATAPELIARHGVGPETAGALLVAAGDNPQRLRSEAAFAHLCGSSPIDASSGLVVRRRLNRGGDRRANEALWRIVMVRMVSGFRTRRYVERRTKEGRSKREIIRCLKRYVARELYPLLVPPSTA